jgi:hypothetical protein
MLIDQKYKFKVIIDDGYIWLGMLINEIKFLEMLMMKNKSCRIVDQGR